MATVLVYLTKTPNFRSSHLFLLDPGFLVFIHILTFFLDPDKFIYIQAPTLLIQTPISVRLRHIFLTSFFFRFKHMFVQDSRHLFLDPDVYSF